ncbi:MAG: cupredoxin family copper-binding protein [Candidatus Hadarchaeales archaeon]
MRKTKGIQVSFAAIVVVILLAAVIVVFRSYGPAPGQETVVGENEVKIQGFAFNPSSITINVGTAITWKNFDSVTHTVTSTGGPTSFDSGNISPGQTWQYIFTQAGTYTYKCTPHPYMTGTVIVQ